MDSRFTNGVVDAEKYIEALVPCFLVVNYRHITHFLCHSFSMPLSEDWISWSVFGRVLFLQVVLSFQAFVMRKDVAGYS